MGMLGALLSKYLSKVKLIRFKNYPPILNNLYKFVYNLFEVSIFLFTEGKQMKRWFPYTFRVQQLDETSHVELLFVLELLVQHSPNFVC